MSKTVHTRIQNKIDTSENWAKATNFTPLKGEIIIYSDLKKIKIGDGTTKVSALQFLADDNTHQSIKTLKTDNATAQATSASEAIAGSGTINLHKVSKTGSYNDLLNKPTIPTIPTNYVTTNTAQDISGKKTFLAPASASGEQATAIFKTANGGQIIFGKEGPNSGSMIALDQVAGTRRLNFRASATPGAIVWSQPESGSALFYDVDRVEFRQPASISFSNATNITLGKIKNAKALGTDANGKIVAKNGTASAVTGISQTAKYLKGSFTGSQATGSVSLTAKGSVSLTNGTAPSLTIATTTSDGATQFVKSISSTAASASGTGTFIKEINGGTGSLTTNSTASGGIEYISALSTKSITPAGKINATLSGSTLVVSFAGDSISGIVSGGTTRYLHHTHTGASSKTTGSAVTGVTGGTATATLNYMKFTAGTTPKASATFTGSAATGSVTLTPTGSVSLTTSTATSTGAVKYLEAASASGTSTVLTGQ